MYELAPDSAETLRLLEHAAAGDEVAFERLFARYRPQLRQFVGRRLDDKLLGRLDPSDVVQETQLDAFRRLDRFLQRRPMPFRLWLCRTAYQRMLMLRRRHIVAARRSVDREVRLPDRSSLQLAQEVGAGSSPSAALSRAELADRVRLAVGQLRQSDRDLVFMRHFDGLGYEEIGCILGIPAATARQRHGRALLKLHKFLGGRPEGPGS